jgi:hypothetical protein
VAIFTKDHLQCSVVLQLLLLVFSIKHSNSSLLIVAGCYCPPSAPACNLLALSSLLGPYSKYEFVLIGDLNGDMIKPPAQVLKQ